MEIRQFTDPLTAVGFQGVRIDDTITITNALTGEPTVFKIFDDCIMLPLKMCEPIKVINAQETCMKLHISRQRLSQLVNTEMLHPIYLGNSQYFVLDSVLEYKRNRKVGRPKKD